uniref:(northern house mosquito) hypothetical protein n=1 Tax=Culex pipiens TaxID=7175 RepID=A0A8D8L424_CULPI
MPPSLLASAFCLFFRLLRRLVFLIYSRRVVTTFFAEHTHFIYLLQAFCYCLGAAHFNNYNPTFSRLVCFTISNAPPVLSLLLLSVAPLRRPSPDHFLTGATHSERENPGQIPVFSPLTRTTTNGRAWTRKQRWPRTQKQHSPPLSDEGCFFFLLW